MALRKIDERTQYHSIEAIQRVQYTFIRKRLFVWTNKVNATPNESTVLFDDDGNASVFLRRDADTFSAQFGTSKPPFTKWEWHDLGIYIGGPAAVAVSKNRFIVAGRHVKSETREFSTRIWLFDSDSRKLEELHRLPSSKDTSYPGLVVENDRLYVSYYSCHVDNEARVYLACLSGVSELTN